MTEPVEIPWESLPEETLHGVLEEFVTRDGTQTASAEASIKQVLGLLKRGKLRILFDPDEETCHVVEA